MLPRHQQDLEIPQWKIYAFALYLAAKEGLISYQTVISLIAGSSYSIYRIGSLSGDTLVYIYQNIPNFSSFFRHAETKLRRGEIEPEQEQAYEELLHAAIEDGQDLETGNMFNVGIHADGTSDFITPDRRGPREPPLSASNTDRLAHGLPPRRPLTFDEGKSFYNLLCTTQWFVE